MGRGKYLMKGENPKQPSRYTWSRAAIPARPGEPDAGDGATGAAGGAGAEAALALSSLAMHCNRAIMSKRFCALLPGTPRESPSPSVPMRSGTVSNSLVAPS